MFPATVHKRRKTKIVALIKTWDGWLEMASWLFLMVRCRQGHGSVRLLHTSVDIGLRENIYSVNKLHQQRIAVQASNNSCMKNIFHLEENLPKKSWQSITNTECKSHAPPPPQDSGCQDRVLLCYAAVARFLLLAPGPWYNPHIIGHSHHLRTITETSAPNCPECPAPAHALPQLKMKRR